MNDIFCAIKDGLLFNYADDNSILVTGKSKQEVNEKLQKNAQTVVSWCTKNQMAANPAKFQTMIAEEKTSSQITFDENKVIHSEKHVKLLGIYLDNNMSFNKHISELLVKASRQLNCLKRIAHSFNQDTKLLLYKSFVLANFNYCPIVWHHCGRSNTKKLEKVQERALKFTLNDYSADYNTLLQKANLPSLEIQRLRDIATEVYKVYNRLSPEIISDLFETNERPYNLRSKNTFKVSHKRTTKYGLHSFKHFGITIWNGLPSKVRYAADLKTFKTLIKTWSGPSCGCNFCDS
jgi:hypothetical protein